jgi:hypothetical protein
LNGVNPEAYLAEALSKIAAGQHPMNCIVDLLPWNLSPSSASVAA